MGKHHSSPAPTPPASGSARSRAGRAPPAGLAGSKRALAAPTPRAAPCSPEIRGCSPACRELGQPQTGPGPPEKPQGREETLSPAPQGSGPPPRAFVLRSPLMSLPGRRLPETFRSSRPATSGPRIPGGDQPDVTPWRRGSPGAWGQTVVVAPGERLRSGPVRRHRSAVGRTEEAPVPLEEENWPAARGRAWEEKLGSGRRAISTQIRADPGKALPQRQKRSSDSPGGALPTESYPEFSSNYWQDAPEHAERIINPPAVGRPRARRGRFRGGRGYLLAGLSPSRSGGWRGPTGYRGCAALPASSRLRIPAVSLGWTGSKQAGLPTARPGTLPAGRHPASRPARGPTAAACAQTKTQGTKGERGGRGQHNAAGTRAARRCHGEGGSPATVTLCQGTEVTAAPCSRG